jgi:hypothetical protein
MIVPGGTKEDSSFSTDHWEVTYALCNTIKGDLLHSRYSGFPKREVDVPTLRVKAGLPARGVISGSASAKQTV